MRRFLALLTALCLLICGITPVWAADMEVTYVDSGPTIGFSDNNITYNTRIRLTITDQAGDPIAGALYGLYKTDDSLVQELTSDAYGIALSGDVYYLEEITAPQGFQPNEERTEIVLTDVCVPSRVDITAKYEPITGWLKVIKLDEEDNPLPGAKFEVINNTTNEKVDDITTGADGTATTIELPYGPYSFYEYEAPDDYVTEEIYGEYWVEEHGATVEATIWNYHSRGTVYIMKIGEDGRKIPGAVFSIYKADSDEWVKDIVTKSDGSAYANDLRMGDYYVVEKSVPDPYVLDDTKHSFSLIYQDTDYVKFDIVNKVKGSPGRIKLTKTDDKGNPLSQVKFSLYRSWDGKELEELVTDENGVAESGDLIPGDYYIIETQGKPGYTPIEGQFPFEIDGTGAVIEKTIVNPEIKVFGKVKIIKEDDEGNPIQGVKFNLFCSEDKLLEEMITGKDGTCVSGVLNEGDYYLIEQEGVSGYLTDTTQHKFSITDNEVTVPVKVVNPRITGRIKIVKTGNSGEPLPGVTFGLYDAGGKELSQLATGEDGTILSDSLYYGDYTLRELSTVDGYELIDTPIPFSILEQDEIVEIPVSNPMILGNLEVIKYDIKDETHYLAGAVFGVFNGKGQILSKITTNSSGQAMYTDLPKGNYLLKELKAPEGYILEENFIPFSIKEQGQTQKISVPNKKGFGKLEIHKTGEDGNALSGVRFDIFRTSTGEVVGNITTDDEGKTSIELPLGKYELKETATVSGYELLSSSISFNLTQEAETIKLPIQNRLEAAKEGHIKLIKTDSTNGNGLPGAVFGIYHEDELVGEITSGQDGAAISLPLKVGKYYLQEIRTPDGYLLDTEKHQIEVIHGETTEISLVNTPVPQKPSTIKITKLDAASGEPLSGAKFTIQQDDQEWNITTDERGFGQIELPAGEYTLEEEQAPEGYQLQNGKMPFRLTAGENKDFVIWNTKKDSSTELAELELIKVDAGSQKKLGGAIFSVSDADGNKMGELLSGEDGRASMKLPAGDYTLVEIQAPEGFIIMPTPLTIHLNEGEHKELTIQNTPVTNSDKPAILHVIKIDSVSGAKLSGAEFSVYDTDNKKLDSITTDQDGEASLELPAGEYVLREDKAPAGYILWKGSVTLTLKPGKTQDVRVRNVKEKEPDKPAVSGTLSIVKVDSDNKTTLKGASFGIYHADSGKSAGEITTGQDGTGSLQLPAGDYYIKEIKAPDGYKLLTEKISVRLEASKNKEVRVKNFKDGSSHAMGSLLVIKKDGVTGDFLKNASFSVYEKNGDKKGNLKTDRDGEASLDLPAGDYFLREQEAPKGYQLDRTKISFSIIEGQTKKLTVENFRIKDVESISPNPEKPGAAPESSKTEGPTSPNATGTSAMSSSGTSNSPDSSGTTTYNVPQVSVPRTGESAPTLQYVIAGAFLIASGVCGILLLHQYKKENRRWFK